MASRSKSSRPTGAARTMSVIAQDPSVRDAKGRIIMAALRLPDEALTAGPMGYRVQIVDYDTTAQRYHGAHALPASSEREPAAWKEGRPSIVDDYRFHAQNVYALVMKTLSRFEYALGRRIGWSFATHQIKVAPHGMLDANAFYAPGAEGLVFGYFPGMHRRTVYTCLSHDVVVHETTHALLDALRERFLDPSSPDQAALHEGFADVIALLSVFAQQELVEALLRGPRKRPKRGGRPETIDASRLTVEALKQSALFGLADEMGEEMEGVRGSALRQSTRLPVDPALKDTEEFQEPHRRGELLVAAVLHAFVTAWAKWIAGSAAAGQKAFGLRRVAEGGADIADLLVTMWIRAIDYMPPVHLEFGDALSAALTADTEARPDDSRYNLRDAALRAFAAYGFVPAADTASEGLWKRAPADLSYASVRFESMRTDKDEVFRFLWDNRDALELRADTYAKVLSVRPSTRVGQDGFTLHETLAEYYQVARLTPAELRGLGIRPPRGWIEELKAARAAKAAKAAGRHPASRPVNTHANDDADDAATDDDGMPSDDAADDGMTTPLYGGGTLIFDEYGRLKYHIHNDVFGKARQSKRLAYLYDAGLLRAGRTGARLSSERLSALHRLRALDARRFPREGW